jgi:hypothetical protein
MTIANVDEGKRAEIAQPVYPAEQDDLGAHVGRP